MDDANRAAFDLSDLIERLQREVERAVTLINRPVERAGPNRPAAAETSAAAPFADPD